MKKILFILLLASCCYAQEDDIKQLQEDIKQSQEDIKQSQIDSVNLAGKHIKPKQITTQTLDVGGYTTFTSSVTFSSHTHTVGVATFDVTTSTTPVSNSIYKDNIIKAWVNFNGSTMVINDSFNIYTIKDLGTGIYEIVFDRDFANVNYITIIMVSNQGGTGALLGRIKDGGTTVGSIQIETFNTALSAVDPLGVQVIVIGDQN